MITNCRLATACTGLYTEENNKNYLTENMKVDNKDGVNGNGTEVYGDINNKRIKYNPVELRAQSGDRAHHGQSLK